MGRKQTFGTSKILCLLRPPIALRRGSAKLTPASRPSAARNVALNARSTILKGDKVEEVHGPPISLTHGDKPGPATTSVSSTDRCRLDVLRRDRFFAQLAGQAFQVYQPALSS